MSQNFTGNRAGQAIAVTTGSVATLLDNNGGADADVLIDNRGAADAYFLFGGASQVVTPLTGIRLPVGGIAIYGKGSATHIAVIGAAATQLVAHIGEGV